MCPAAKQKINRFLRTSKQYKKFVDIVDFITSLLTPKQKQILEIQYEGETIDFKTQLSLALENRYKNRDGDIEELKTRSTKTLDKYSFLFETNLNPLQIRTILIRELSEVISFGFLCNDAASEDSYIGGAIKEKYPNLPPRKQGEKLIYFGEECFYGRHHLTFISENIQDLGYSEFFKKTKGYFEQLNSCEPEYIDKYREKIYKEIRFATGMGDNHSFGHPHASPRHNHHCLLEISKVKTNTSEHLQEAVEEILAIFQKKKYPVLQE